VGNEPEGNPTIVTGCSAHLARGPSLGAGCVVPPVITTTAPSDFRSTLHHCAGPLLIGFTAAGHREVAIRGRHAGVETEISSSEDNLLTIPRPLRREVLGHLLQVPRCCPWPSPFRYRLGSSLFHPLGQTRTTTLVGLHLRYGLVSCHRLHAVLSLRFDAGISPDVGSQLPGHWRLPGPDLHRLAALSLSLGYVTMTSLSSWRPELLDAHRDCRWSTALARASSGGRRPDSALIGNAGRNVPGWSAGKPRREMPALVGRVGSLDTREGCYCLEPH